MILIELPNELLLMIGSHLPWKDLYSLILTNHHFSSLHLPYLLPLAVIDIGHTILLHAARTGNLSLVKTLFKTYNVSQHPPDDYSSSALHLAAQNGHIKVVELLLKNGASVELSTQAANYIDLSRQRVRIIDEEWPDELHRLETIAQVSNLIRWKRPLHLAACSGHLDIVHMLIEFGADVNRPDSGGWTPLCYAVSAAHMEVVKTLVLNYGVRDRGSISALFLASWPVWNEEMLDFLQKHAECDESRALSQAFSGGRLVDTMEWRSWEGWREYLKQFRNRCLKPRE